MAVGTVVSTGHMTQCRHPGTLLLAHVTFWLFCSCPPVFSFSALGQLQGILSGLWEIQHGHQGGTRLFLER